MVCRADELMCFLETDVSNDTAKVMFQAPIHTLFFVCQCFFIFTFGVSKNALGLIRQGRVDRIDRRFSGDGKASAAVLVRSELCQSRQAWFIIESDLYEMSPTSDKVFLPYPSKVFVCFVFLRDVCV